MRRWWFSDDFFEVAAEGEGVVGREGEFLYASFAPRCGMGTCKVSHGAVAMAW